MEESFVRLSFGLDRALYPSFNFKPMLNLNTKLGFKSMLRLTSI